VTYNFEREGKMKLNEKRIYNALIETINELIQNNLNLIDEAYNKHIDKKITYWLKKDSDTKQSVGLKSVVKPIKDKFDNINFRKGLWRCFIFSNFIQKPDTKVINPFYVITIDRYVLQPKMHDAFKQWLKEEISIHNIKVSYPYDFRKYGKEVYNNGLLQYSKNKRDKLVLNKDNLKYIDLQSEWGNIIYNKIRKANNINFIEKFDEIEKSSMEHWVNFVKEKNEKIRTYNINLELNQNLENIRNQRGTMNKYFNEWGSKTDNKYRNKKRIFFENEFIIDKPDLDKDDFDKFTQHYRTDKSQKNKALKLTK